MQSIFIARQPIFDRNLKLFGYELLFRSADPSSDGFDGDAATSEVMWNAVNGFDLSELVDNKRAFINLTESFIKKPELISVPTKDVVLEILEDVVPDQEVIDGVRMLKERGYTIALDDYVFDPVFAPLLPYIDLVKVDVYGMDPAVIEREMPALRRTVKKTLAEKVETQQEFDFLFDQGFDLFQGYFFAKPNVVQGRKISPSHAGMVDLISRLNEPDIDTEEIVAVLNRDVGLGVAVLRLANSASNGFSRPVESVRQAVVMLGRSTIRNWIMLLSMARVSGKPNELIKMTLIRAKLCELIAIECKEPKPDTFFTVGLVSTLDAMMDQPLDKLLQSLQLGQDINLAVLSQDGRKGAALHCAIALEKGLLDEVKHPTLSLAALIRLHYAAMHWSYSSSTELNVMAA